MWSNWECPLASALGSIALVQHLFISGSRSAYFGWCAYGLNIGTQGLPISLATLLLRMQLWRIAGYIDADCKVESPLKKCPGIINYKMLKMLWELGFLCIDLLQRGSESVSQFHLFHLFIDWSGTCRSFFGVGVVVWGCLLVVWFVCFVWWFLAYHFDRVV